MELYQEAFCPQDSLDSASDFSKPKSSVEKLMEAYAFINEAKKRG